MSTQEERDQAFKDGQTEAQYIHDEPFGYATGGGVADRPSDPDLAAEWDKGFTGDGDKK
jgi:hypothetical protein